MKSRPVVAANATTSNTAVSATARWPTAVEPAILDVLVGFWWFPCSFCCMFLSLGMPWLGPLSSKGSTLQRCCLQWQHCWCPCLMYVCQKVFARFWKSFSNCRVVIGASLPVDPVHPELVYGVWKGSEFRFNNLTLVTQLARDSLSADIGRAQVWRLSPAVKNTVAPCHGAKNKKNTVRKYGNELVMVIHPYHRTFRISSFKSTPTWRIYSLRQWPPSLQRSAVPQITIPFWSPGQVGFARENWRFDPIE